MQANIYHLSIPMQRPFGHAEANRQEAESVILSIEYNGITGIGECVPRKYVTGETIDSVIKAIMSLNIKEVLSSIDFSSLYEATSSFHKISLVSANEEIVPLNAICAVELALLDLIGKYFKCSVRDIIKYYFLPYALQNTAESELYKTTQVMDLTLTPEEFLKTRGPFHHVKIKVNNSMEDNISRVSSVRKALGNEVPISVDANMCWSFDDGIEMVTALKPYNIHYYEEPLKKGDFVSYKKLREATGAKILLDESLCDFNNAQEAIENKACDAFNIRISKCGGIVRSVALMKLAYKYRLKFQIGAQVAETGPLIAAGRHLVGAIDKEHYLAYEAGQPDRLFADNYIINGMPLVDRKTNLATKMDGIGLGINLNGKHVQYLKKEISWSDAKWEIN